MCRLKKEFDTDLGVVLWDSRKNSMEELDLFNHKLRSSLKNHISFLLLFEWIAFDEKGNAFNFLKSTDIPFVRRYGGFSVCTGTLGNCIDKLVLETHTDGNVLLWKHKGVLESKEYYSYRYFASFIIPADILDKKWTKEQQELYAKSLIDTFLKEHGFFVGSINSFEAVDLLLKEHLIDVSFFKK